MVAMLLGNDNTCGLIEDNLNIGQPVNKPLKIVPMIVGFKRKAVHILLCISG